MPGDYCITDTKTYLVDVPVDKKVFPFSVSYGALTGLKRVFLRLTAADDQGHTVQGWGEASPLYPFSIETPLSVYELLTLNYSHVLSGKTIAAESKTAAKQSIDSIITQCERYLGQERLTFTQSAIDFALHDLAGKILGIPAYEFLTGQPNFTPVRACWSTTCADTEQARASARKFADMGYAIKIKLSGKAERDISTCAAIISTLVAATRNPSIRADANSGYTESSYLDFCRGLQQQVAEKDLEAVNFYVEEPIDTRIHGKAGFVSVMSASPFRTMADETLYTVQDGIDLIELCREAGLLDRLLFNIKVQKVGGLRNAVRLKEIADQNQIPIMIGGMFPSSYGKLANCHFAIACNNLLDSDGLHPSRDYIDTSQPLITNLEELEIMAEGKRRTDVFTRHPGFGGIVDEQMLHQHSINIGLEGYYPDFEGFSIPEVRP